MNIIYTIAKLTFREAIRRRIVLAALLLGLAFLIIFGLGFHYIQADLMTSRTTRLPAETVRAQAYNLIMMAGLYVVNFLTIAIAALITADTLAGEIQSGTIQATVTKPIQRSEVVIGKWFGNAVLLLLYLAFLGGGVILSVWAMSGYQTPNWLAGLGLMYFNSLIIMSLTLAFSSRFSTLATGGAIFGAYGLAFVGGWVERIGSALQNQTAINLGILSSLLLPNETLWNKATGLMTSPLLNLTGLTPFTSASQPSTFMLAYAGFYLLLSVFAAIRLFGTRDL